MPINAGYKYGEAEIEYGLAKTADEKLAGLRRMLQTAPKHKGSENLVADIKRKISRLIEREEKARSRRKGKQEGLKKEGSARV